MRCKRESFLYHGTLLYDFDLPLVGKLLAMPPRQPDYRRNRSHSAFVANLTLGRAALCTALATVWGARAGDGDWPQSRVRDLVAARYQDRDWNHQR
jgi:lipoate-protein ligase A